MKTVDLNSKEKPVDIAIICCILSFLAYSSNYVGRSSLTILASELNSQQILSTQLFGIACSIFSIVYACGRFISGYCADFIQSKKLITTGVLVSGVCNLLIGLTMEPYTIIVLWTINAIAQSTVYGSLLIVAAAVCNEKNKTAYMVVISITIGFGQVVGFLLIPFLVKLGGLRAGFLVPGIISVSIALLIIFFFPVIPEKGKLSDINSKAIIRDIKFFLSNKDYQAVLFPCIANGVIRDGITIWLASYIMREYGIDLSVLAYFAVAVPLVNTLGKFVFPYFYKLVNENELKLGLLCQISLIITLTPLCIGLKNPIIAIACLAISALFTSIANMSFIGMWPLRFEYCNKVAFAAGMIDTPIYLGAGITSAFFGFMVESFGFKSLYITLVIFAAISTIPLYLSTYHQRIS